MSSRCSKEKTRQRLQADFDSQQLSRERNRRGQFATPFDLAQQIVAAALTYHRRPVKRVRFLEPAVGTGAFYSAVANALHDPLLECAVGFETDPALARIANQLWHDAGLQVRNRDFTLTPPPPTERHRFNLLVTNPPYVRHHHLSTTTKDTLRNLVTSRLNLQPSGFMGLYGYFILLSHSWMQQAAIMSWLIPTEFMDVGYGATLRQYLSTKVQLLRVHRFDASDPKFPDADVTSAVIILRNNLPPSDHNVLFTTGPHIQSPQTTVPVPLHQLTQIAKWTSIGKRPLTDILDANHPQPHAVTLGDLFHVKRGLATGANSFFIMTPEEAKQRGIPTTFLRPILPSPRHLRDRPVIESDDRGFPLAQPTLLLLHCDLPRHTIAKTYTDLYHYILKGEREGLHHRYLLSRRHPWYRQEERTPAPILCQYMGRTTEGRKPIRFYRNKSQAVATNVYLMLYPKPAILDRCIDTDAFLDRVLALVRSLDNYDVSQHGRTYGGGLEKIEPGELPHVRLPQTHTIDQLITGNSYPRLL